jgi:hypothetical protein
MHIALDYFAACRNAYTSARECWLAAYRHQRLMDENT